jgi:hypothetical protein
LKEKKEEEPVFEIIESISDIDQYALGSEICDQGEEKNSEENSDNLKNMIQSAEPFNVNIEPVTAEPIVEADVKTTNLRRIRRLLRGILGIKKVKKSESVSTVNSGWKGIN